MTTTKRHRRLTKPLGARALLVALSLSGALGGWAGLAVSAANKNAASNVQSSLPVTSPPISVASQNATNIQLAPIPTILPPPGNLAASATTSIQPLTQPAALAPIPTAPQVVIRRPIARSRSSR